jgi:hypothetical protein
MNVTTERLQEIENEREKTYSDPRFQKWVEKLNVSKMYNNNIGLFQAKDMMNQYDYSNYEYKVS